jgi:hypothetical protein
VQKQGDTAVPLGRGPVMRRTLKKASRYPALKCSLENALTSRGELEILRQGLRSLWQIAWHDTEKELAVL